MKKTAAIACAFMTGCILCSTTPVQAANATFTASTKDTSKITVEEVEYDLVDRYDAIEFDFLTGIQLKRSATVTVKDNSGNKYNAKISDHVYDDISLDVTGLKAGKTYTVKIKGIKQSSASKYGTLTVQFSIPKATGLKVREVDFDHDDRELSFEFNKNVNYNNVKVVITNTSGTKTYSTQMVEKDKDELTVRVNGLSVGKSYKYKITGVKAAGSSTNKTLTGSFVAIDLD